MLDFKFSRGHTKKKTKLNEINLVFYSIQDIQNTIILPRDQYKRDTSEITSFCTKLCSLIVFHTYGASESTPASFQTLSPQWMVATTMNSTGLEITRQLQPLFI